MTTSTDKFNWKNVMKYRNFLFGFAAVWIVFFHIRAMVGAPKDGLLRGFLSLGNIGVDVFMFLSAVGLSYSIEKNSLKEFYKNRFLRLWVPFLIICVPYYMWRDSATGITLERIHCFILDTTAINFWIKAKVPFWYVSLATAMYLFYPLLYKIYRRDKRYLFLLGTACVALEIFLVESGIYTYSEKALSRIPIILIGIYMSDIVKENREIKNWQVLLSAIVFAGMLCIQYFLPRNLNIMYDRFIYGIITVPMIILIAWAMEKLRKIKLGESVYKFFCFFGGFSLELYLVHNGITRILKFYDILYFPAYTYYLWVFPLSVVLAIGFNKIAEDIVSSKKLKS